MKKTPKNLNRKTLIIGFIADYSQKYGKSPTMNEIRKGVKLRSLSGVHQHLQEMGLTLKGDKFWWQNNKREVEKKFGCPMCKRPFNQVMIPIRGTVVEDKKWGNKVINS